MAPGSDWKRWSHALHGYVMVKLADQALSASAGAHPAGDLLPNFADAVRAVEQLPRDARLIAW